MRGLLQCLILCLGCGLLAAQRQYSQRPIVTITLNNSLTDIYTVENPLQLYLDDILRMRCPSEDFAMYRLESEAEYSTCSTTKDNATLIGLCIRGLEGLHIIQSIVERFEHSNSSIVYIPGTTYYIVGFIYPKFSGPPCSEGVRVVARVDAVRPPTTQRPLVSAGLTPSDEQSGLPWLHIGLGIAGGAIVIGVLITAVIVVVCCAWSSSHSRSYNVEMLKLDELEELGEQGSTDSRVEPIAKTNNVDGHVQPVKGPVTEKVNSSPASGRDIGEEESKIDLGNFSPKKGSHHVGKPPSQQQTKPNVTNPKTKNAHTDGVSFSKNNERIDISDQPPSASSGASSKRQSTARADSKPDNDRAKAAQNDRLHNDKAASTNTAPANSSKPPLKKTCNGSSVVNSGEPKKPSNPAPPPPRPSHQLEAGSRSLSIQAKIPAHS